MKVREFSKSDWQAFSGAMRWADGEDPLIGDGLLANGDEYIVIIDRSGACITINSPTESQDIHMLDMALRSQDEGRMLAQRLGQPRHRVDFLLAGFKQV